MDSKKVDWINPEVKSFYTLLNEVYSALLIQSFSYVKKVMIDPETFNDAFLKGDSWNNDVVVYVCADYTSKEYVEACKNNASSATLGSKVVTLMLSIPTLLPGKEIMGNRKLYPNLKNNTTVFCEGVIEYHY